MEEGRVEGVDGGCRDQVFERIRHLPGPVLPQTQLFSLLDQEHYV